MAETQLFMVTVHNDDFSVTADDVKNGLACVSKENFNKEYEPVKCTVTLVPAEIEAAARLRGVFSPFTQEMLEELRAIRELLEIFREHGVGTYEHRY